MTDNEDAARPRRWVPRVVVVWLVSLLSFAAVIAGGVGFYRLGAESGREAAYREGYPLIPSTDIGFWWYDGPGGTPPADPKYDLVRAWVESHILTNDYYAAYPGYLATMTANVTYLGFRNYAESRVGTYRLLITAFDAGPDMTSAQVCVDGLGVSEFLEGLVVEARPLSWYALDLTFQRSAAPAAVGLRELHGELPGDQPLPPADVFGDWMATKATPIASDACALWWAEGYGWPHGLQEGPSSAPVAPPEDEPGW